jgi:hypothetical protein
MYVTLKLEGSTNIREKCRLNKLLEREINYYSEKIINFRNWMSEILEELRYQWQMLT